MPGFAAAARRRLGELLGGDEGRDHLEATDAFFMDELVRSPERLTGLLAPGFRSRDPSPPR
jgi:hypothetical protein